MRVAFILMIALVVGLSAFHFSIERWGAQARAGGGVIYAHREQFERQPAPASGLGPLVVWLGDSTIAGLTHASYPQELGKRMTLAGVRTQVVAAPGFDAFAYYGLLGPILEERPRLVVIVAHLRVMNAGLPGVHHFNDLLSGVPADELGHALLLPLAARGVTLPKLFLYRLLNDVRVREVAIDAAGLRALARRWAFGRRERWFEALPVRRLPPFEAMRQTVSAYDFPLSRRNPYVRMLEACVAMARRVEVPVLVLGVPIPWEVMQRLGRYDRAVVTRRMALLGTVVEGAGGQFIDLHHELGRSEFADSAGHYSWKGVNRLTTLLYPRLLAALGLRAPAPR